MRKIAAFPVSEEDIPLTKCFQQKEEAIKGASKFGKANIFIPKCNADGTFAEIQCHEPSQYCWCVSANDGKPLPGTSTKDGTPKCKGKKTFPAMELSASRISSLHRLTDQTYEGRLSTIARNLSDLIRTGQTTKNATR